MNTYELAVVLEGKATPAKKKSIRERLEKIVKTNKGELMEVEDWGVKDLAYPINSETTGQYLIFTLKLDSTGAKVLPQMLKVEEDVIRYLLVKVNEKIKNKKEKKK